MASSATPLSTDQKAARWWRWLRQRRVVCAKGHHYPYKFRIPERGGLRCEHWIAEERRECGRWTYLIAMTGGGVIAIDVDQADLDEMEHLDSKTAVIDYLGIFPE